MTRYTYKTTLFNITLFNKIQFRLRIEFDSKELDVLGLFIKLKEGLHLGILGCLIAFTYELVSKDVYYKKSL